jgi:glucoamylase
LVNELLGRGTPHQGVIGNGSLTACVQPDGNLRSLYWPRMGYAEQMKEAEAGMFLESNRGGKFLWLSQDGWEVSQRYLDHCNIIETRYRGNDLEVMRTAFVDPQYDVYSAVFRVSTDSAKHRKVRLLLYQDPELEETTWGDATFYDHPHDSVIQYRMSTYFAFGSTSKSSSHQCGVDGGGGDARTDCQDGQLANNDAALYRGRRGVNSALAYDLGEISVGHPGTLCYLLAAGKDREQATSILETARGLGASSLMTRAEAHWVSLAQRGGRNGTDRISLLVERSILTLLQLCDRKTGGIIACPSTDPDYRYVWPRDAFYSALALDRSGYHDEARRFYLWCKEAQAKSGVLHQRYFASPELIGPAWGPAWGEEIDETATALWGMQEHLRLTGDRNFLGEVWPFIRGAASYLAKSVDQAGRVKNTMNLWEENPSRHVYSTSTVAAGLKAASESASELGHSSDAKKWSGVSELVKKNLLDAFWDEGLGHFIKTAEPKDEQVDISSLSISFPFGVLPDSDPRMVKTAKALRDAFKFRVGGVGRFPSDNNYGGNPWIISTCWMAIHYANAGDKVSGRNLLNWCADHATGLGLMPEQVDKDKGVVLSAVPLAWSHAMFIMAAQALGTLKQP